MYCLDTDVIVDFLRGKHATAEKIKKISSALTTTCLNVCELYKGAYLSKMPENEKAIIDEFLKKINILNFDNKSCDLYGRNFALLRGRGRPTQELDLLIACMCISNNQILVTGNKKHFSNIPDLKLDEW